MTLRVLATSAVLCAIPTARRPISAKSSRTVGGQRPPHPNDLGDVQREIPHPFQVARGADRRHHRAQVARDRRVEQHGLDGDLLDLRPEGVDRGVARDHLMRQAFAALQQRRGGLLHGGRRGRAISPSSDASSASCLGSGSDAMTCASYTASGPGIRPVTT